MKKILISWLISVVFVGIGKGANVNIVEYGAKGDGNTLKVTGVTLKYAGAWTSHYFQSKEILIEGIKIESIGVAHNDGIGIDGCQDVRIK
jgi:polygalacturonase